MTGDAGYRHAGCPGLTIFVHSDYFPCHRGGISILIGCGSPDDTPNIPYTIYTNKANETTITKMIPGQQVARATHHPAIDFAINGAVEYCIDCAGGHSA